MGIITLVGMLMLTLACVVHARSDIQTSPVDSTGPVFYECDAAAGPDKRLQVNFYRTDPPLALLKRGHEIRPAFGVASASGAKYEGDGLMFWDAHGEATVSWDGVDFKCKPR